MSSAERENERASELIERLLVDPEFRAEFRRDPAVACVAAGLPDLAAELAGSARSMDTLMVRESRSSLAGVVMAVAVEGMGVAEAQALMQHGPAGALRGKLSHGGALRDPLRHVRRAASPAALPRELRGLRGGSPVHGLGGPAPARVAEASPASGPAGSGAPASSGAPSASVSASAPAGSAAAAGSAAPSGSGGPAASVSPAPEGPPASVSPAPGGPPYPSAPPAAASYPSAPPAAPAPPRAPEPGGAAGSAGAPAPPEPGAQPAQGGVVPVWPDQPSAGGGAAAGGPAAGSAALGAGGTPGAMVAALDSPRLSASPNVRAFLASGGVDPRMVSVLDSALANHTIGLGQVEAVSDPVHVQAVDIVSVDGQPVGPNNFAARDLVTEIAALDPSERPDEIGTPWPIRSQGFFSDAGATNRLHLAFEMASTDTPPAGAGPQGAGAMAPPAAGQVAYPAPTGGQVASPGQVAAPEVQVAAAQPVVANLGQTPSAEVPLSSVVPAPVAAATPGSGVDAALAYARAMIGKLPESAGSNLGPQLDRFEADFGFHGAPWCGIFAGHVLEAAGLKPPHTVAAVASILDLARNGDPPFLKGVLPVSEARPGDLVTFGGTEHVAVVTKVDAAGVHTIAGNTGQSNVSETTYSPSSVTGVVRPDYAAGKPGSIPGVWDYSGVQPPAVGASASVPAAAGVAEEPVGGGAPVAPAAASVAEAPGGGAAPGAPSAAQPSANAALPMPQAAAPPQPGPNAFNGPASRAPGRNTVQFLPAVQPSPGSPLFQQAPRPVEVAQSVIQQPSAAAATEPVSSTAAAPQPVTGGLLDQAPGGPAATGGSLSVSSSLLTAGQGKFAGRLAELTGLDPRVVAAWELAEESGSAAQGREAASNFNWLNIGYFDSGAGKIAFDKTFSDPISAAEQSAKFLKGEWGGASSSIRAILNSVGHRPDEQMAAIANSDWASSHYGGGANLHGTYDELADIHVEKTAAT